MATLNSLAFGGPGDARDDGEAYYQLIDPSGLLSSTSQVLFMAFGSFGAIANASTVTQLSAFCLRAI